MVRIAFLISIPSDTSRSSRVLAIRRRDRQLSRWRAASQEVGKQIVAGRSEDRFRVELHAFNRKRAMSESHDQLVGFGSDYKIVRKRRALDGQRVISRGLERIGNPGKDAATVV